MLKHVSPRLPLWSAGLAVLLVLSGCAATPAPESSPGADAGVENSAPVDQSDSTAESSSGASAVSLPATYPLSEVPLVSGVVVSAADAGLLWNVILVPEAPMDEVADEAEALLTAQGMSLVAAKGDNRGYHSETYAVYVNLHDDGTVSYTVSPR